MNYISNLTDRDKSLARLAVLFIGSNPDTQNEFIKFATNAYTQDLEKYFNLVNDYLTGKVPPREMPGPIFISRGGWL